MNQRSQAARSPPPAAQVSLLWRRGELPDVFELLEARPELTGRQCADALLVDQDRRWRCGQALPLEEYFSRCPLVATQRPLKVELITKDYGYRLQRGETPTAEEYARRFPDVAELLPAALQPFQIAGDSSASERSPADAVSIRIDVGASRDAVEQRLDQFDNAWHQGQTPRISNFLPSKEDDQHLDILVELIKIDLEYRWRLDGRAAITTQMVSTRHEPRRPICDRACCSKTTSGFFRNWVTIDKYRWSW
jgi:hypothetical protein